MPMSLVFSLTMLQKIASTRKTVVKHTSPKTKRTRPVSFSTAAIMVRLRSRHDRITMSPGSGTSPGCSAANAGVDPRLPARGSA
jgi:hypothetical protein